MAKFNTSLTFNGNAEEAFNFYRTVFGGEFASVMRWKDMPGGCGENRALPESEQNKIMHMSLPLGEGQVLMGNDSLNSNGGPVNIGTNVHIVIGPDSQEQGDQYFARLSEGGTAIMPMQNTFWNAYFGILIDKFGIQWMLNYEKPKAE